jgi:hypothetical protein
MCDSPADPGQVAAAVPRPATGSAVDPVTPAPSGSPQPDRGPAWQPGPCLK